MNTLLRIDSSARRTGSVSRDLTDRIVARFAGAQVVTRDLADGIPHVTEDWIAANFAPADARSADHLAVLRISDELIAEVRAADVIVIGLAVYNFAIPAALKAWIDQVARAGITFRYTETGPEGLLEGKRAIVAMASGGTAVGSEIDFATGYLRFILGFMGITDVSFVAADRLIADAEGAIAEASAQVEALDIAARAA